MPIRILGQVLFPRQQAWQRERTIRHILVAVAVAIVFGAAVVGVMFLNNSRPH